MILCKKDFANESIIIIQNFLPRSKFFISFSFNLFLIMHFNWINSISSSQTIKIQIYKELAWWSKSRTFKSLLTSNIPSSKPLSSSPLEMLLSWASASVRWD